MNIVIDKRVLRDFIENNLSEERSFHTTNIAEIYPELVKKYSQYLSNLPRGENRSLPLPEILRDPDLFGGEEDRIPWVEKAFENAEGK